MCILIHNRRKDLLKEKELRQAMRENSAGFFLVALYKDKPREVLRTLDEKEAIDFWKKIPDDVETAMHFRVPSRGQKSLDNVHGWEEDGILFGHNLTLSDLDGMMTRVKWGGTDSEFFFRKIFIPFYRGLGEDAYKDGKFHPDLDNLVQFICGYRNRFMFVMPDNTVIRYGDWAGNDPDRKVDGEPGFFASNMSYEVTERAWPEKGGKDADTASRFPEYGDPKLLQVQWNTSQMGKEVQGEEAKEDERYGCGYDYYGGVSSGEDEQPTGSTVRELLGDAVVLRVALADVVITNYLSLVKQLKLRSPEEISELDSLAPKWLSKATNMAAEDVAWGFEEITSNAAIGALETYAEELEVQLSKYFPNSPVLCTQSVGLPANKDRIREHYNELAKEIRLFCSIAFVDLNWKATDAEDFFHAYTLEHSKRKGRPFIDEICPDDVLVPEYMKSEDALGSVSNLLKVIKLLENGVNAEDLDYAGYQGY